MYNLKHFFLLVFVLTGSIRSDRCNDCINYDLCPEAVHLLSNTKNSNDRQLLRNVACGFDSTGPKAVPKVCCSILSTKGSTRVQETSQGRNIANHKNLKLLSTECGYFKGDRIWGGDVADLYEFPWMALISHEDRDGIEFKCGGTIINERYILTAAHCVCNKTIAGVRVGEFDISNPQDCQKGVCETHIQDIEVEKHILHKGYDRTQRGINDIALLRLNEDINFNHKNVYRICLPTTSELRHMDLSGKIAVVAGWGLTENRTYSDVLRKVKVPILAAQGCSVAYRRHTPPGYPDTTTNQICAGAIERDSCNRDSGGPLMIEARYKDVLRYVQYGIVSHGPTRCGSKTPGAYVDVRNYMDWILDNMY